MSTKAPALIGLAALGMFIALVAVGAKGVRGTDQFWYLADVLMAKAGRGVVSNYITPITWNPQDGFSPSNLPPPVHNVPATYLAAGINSVLDDAYLAWVICNGAIAVVAALLLYVVACRLVRPTTAAIVAGLFLVSPQTVWLTLNPLMEQGLVLAAVVLGLGAVLLFTRPVAGTLLMTVAVTVFAVSRGTNFLLIPCGILLLCVLAWRGRTSWWLVALFGATSTALSAIGSVLMPQYPIFVPKGMLAINTAADVRQIGNNLTFYYIPDAWPTPSMVAAKVVDGLQLAVVPSSAQELAMETITIVLLVVGVAFGAGTARGKAIAWWALSLFGVYLCVSALMQSQARYLAPVLPLALVLAGKAWEELAARFTVPLRAQGLAAGAFALALTATSALMTSHYIDLAEESNSRLATIEEALGGPGSGTTMVLDPEGRNLAWEAATVIAPSLALSVDGRTPDACVPVEQVERWQVTRVAVSTEWTDEQIRAAFCPTSDGRTVLLTPAGDGLAPLGHRLLQARVGSAGT